MIRDGCGDPHSSFILSTIHSSKGLEYERVYLADMLAGVLPAENRPRGKQPDSPGVNAYEEERRLYYVGMTRAKEQLEKPKAALTYRGSGQKKKEVSSEEVSRWMEACVPGSKVKHQRYGDGTQEDFSYGGIFRENTDTGQGKGVEEIFTKDPIKI